ncbi:NAC domain-containing protein 41-like [Quercus lobata]|uniref:NAC domain-containing protein 41-like n=1 Tax=Quercus lobata TaxID=97700 RepID=UPI0012478E26|nr:NAC domain-containing protein 41-like [Quercus lobata]XP_030959400.1 NAC domain-containing protein 41-like [Quercus lobata]
MAAASSSSSSSTLEWPGGFVFDPLDEVLVIHYLHPKATEISDCKCPEVIPERDLYGTEEPWQIWEKMEKANNCIRNKEEMFFFTRLKRVSSKSNRCKRNIGKGCWKGDGLIPAIETLFPTVEHRYCVKHIYNNFKVDHKGLKLKDAL